MFAGLLAVTVRKQALLRVHIVSVTVAIKPSALQSYWEIILASHKYRLKFPAENMLMEHETLRRLGRISGKIKNNLDQMDS